MKKILFTIFFLSWFTISFCQQDTSFAIHVGERCPDIVFSNMLRYSKKEAKLSDFKGKAVIVDFWATWCVPCVAAFPKLEKIQQKLGSEIQVILVTMDKSESVTEFYNKKADLKLPTSISKRTDPVNSFFPHTEIPYYIWLDKDHIVRAMTDYSQLTEENAERFVRGETGFLKQKNAIAMASRLSAKEAISLSVARSRANPDTNLITLSSLRRADLDAPDRYLRTHYVGPVFENRVMNYNYGSVYTIGRLYCIAFGGYANPYDFGLPLDRFSFRTRLIVESRDREKIQEPRDYTPNISADSSHMWIRKNTYNYILVLPPGEKDSLRRFKVMQEDLVKAFGYKCRIEKRKTKCIILKATGPNIIQTEGPLGDMSVTPYGVSLKNRELAHFMWAYEPYMDGFKLGAGKKTIPCVNETGWKGKVSFEFNIADMNDFDQVKKALNKFNMDLAVEDRELDMVIIYD